jgi:hypothetical protein
MDTLCGVFGRATEPTTHAIERAVGLFAGFTQRTYALWPIVVPAFLIFSGVANAQCTPAGMARFNAIDAQLNAVKAQIRTGNCSLIPKWKALLAAEHAILHRSQRQTVPYTCHVTIKYPPVPNCATRTAQTPPHKKSTATAQPSPPVVAPHPATSPVTQQAASCSTITGLGGDSPAAANCNTGNSLLAAARATRAQDPQTAAEKYRQAADAYRQAGDIELANKVLQEALSLVASRTNPPPPPGASQESRAPVAPPVASPNPNPTAPPSEQATLPGNRPNASPAASGGHWMGTSDPADCANANSVERTGAAWGSTCTSNLAAVCNIVRQNGYDTQDLADTHVGRGAYWVDICPNGGTATAKDQAPDLVCPPGQSANSMSCAPKTTPNITFDALNTQALAACPADTDKTPEQRRSCMAEAKLAYLLANAPNVRASCAGLTDHATQLLCADSVYLHGPSAPLGSGVRVAMRADMKKAVNDLPAWVRELTPRPQHPWEQLPNPCPDGQAVRPTPGGFGAWSCQPLVPLAQLGDKPDAPARTADINETADQVEANMQNVAGLIASAVAPRVGARLAPQERAICLAVAYRAVLAMMKGGAVPIPPMCNAVVRAARTEFASFAHNEFYTGSRGLDGLLAALDTYYQSAGDLFGGDLGAPQRGMQGLGATSEEKKFADCIAAGGTWQSCHGTDAK